MLALVAAPAMAAAPDLYNGYSGTLSDNKYSRFTPLSSGLPIFRTPLPDPAGAVQFAAPQGGFTKPGELFSKAMSNYFVNPPKPIADPAPLGTLQCRG
jgi:hypothetical protein